MCAGRGGDDGGGDDDAPPRVSADWRSFRARLVDAEGAAAGGVPRVGECAEGEARWAHRVARPEEGCVLVARPEVIQEGFFEKGVVLVLSHGEMGTFGLCLNKMLSKSLASVPSDSSSPLGEAFQMAKVECFINNPLMSGGPLGLDSLMILHDKELVEATKVIGNLHCGDLLGAMVAVRTGELESKRCRFFSGYSAWSSGQLDEEIEEGAWDVLATSTQYILDFEHASSDDDHGKCLWSALREKADIS